MMTISFSPLTEESLDHLGMVLRGSWGATCWCMQPRRATAMAGLTTRPHAPGLLAFHELARVDGSRATPRVGDTDVWVIPCITVRKGWRGRGIALALIQAGGAEYAAENGAPAVEAYPRVGSERTGDDNAYF